MIIRVSDPDDRRLEPFWQVRDRDLAGRHGSFMAEGEVVLRMLLSRSSRFVASSCLLSETRARALAPWIGEVAPDLPVLVAPEAALDAIVGFPIHRGVLAAGLRGPDQEASAILPGPGKHAVVLGLVGIANHDNVGGLFRNAAGFGAAAVLLDRTCCDPLYRKAIRVSVGAALTVPFSRGGTAPDMVRHLRNAGFEVFALSPNGREEVGSVRWPPRTALLVGAEGRGLPPEVLNEVQSVSIRMAPGFDSLNVATASGVALHSVRAGWPLWEGD